MGELSFNREKAFAASISRRIAKKNKYLSIDVATYGNRAHLYLRFGLHCNLKEDLNSLKNIQFPIHASRRVDRALGLALRYFFPVPGGNNPCIFTRSLVVVFGGAQTGQSSRVILNKLQKPLWAFSRRGVRVYAVVVGSLRAVVRERLWSITYINRPIYVVPSFRQLSRKVGAITQAIRRQMVC